VFSLVKKLRGKRCQLHPSKIAELRRENRRKIAKKSKNKIFAIGHVYTVDICNKVAAIDWVKFRREKFSTT